MFEGSCIRLIISNVPTLSRSSSQWITRPASSKWRFYNKFYYSRDSERNWGNKYLMWRQRCWRWFYDRDEVADSRIPGWHDLTLIAVSVWSVHRCPGAARAWVTRSDHWAGEQVTWHSLGTLGGDSDHTSLIHCNNDHHWTQTIFRNNMWKHFKSMFQERSSQVDS